MKRLAVAAALLLSLASGLAHADKDRPGLPIPEPSQGELCFEVYFEDISQTICIPAPD